MPYKRYYHNRLWWLTRDIKTDWCFTKSDWNCAAKTLFLAPFSQVRCARIASINRSRIVEKLTSWVIWYGWIVGSEFNTFLLQFTSNFNSYGHFISWIFHPSCHLCPVLSPYSLVILFFHYNWLLKTNNLTFDQRDFLLEGDSSLAGTKDCHLMMLRAFPIDLRHIKLLWQPNLCFFPSTLLLTLLFTHKCFTVNWFQL